MGWRLRNRDRIDTAGHGLVKQVARVLLGTTLTGTGIGHLTFARKEFQAQVPAWLPLDSDFVVLASGVAELALAAGLLATRGRNRVLAGLATAGFFVAIFPGNIAQYVEGTSMYGLDTDAERLARLFFQPVLIAWAMGATDAWRHRPERDSPALDNPGLDPGLDNPGHDNSPTAGG